jgi:hypothetical protein
MAVEIGGAGLIRKRKDSAEGAVVLAVVVKI